MRGRTLVLAACVGALVTSAFGQEQVQVAWTAEYAPTNPLLSAYPVDMAVDDSGNVILLGVQKDDTWEGDVLLLKYNAEGQLLWERTYDTPGRGDEDPVGLALDSLGNAYVAATTENNEELTNILVLKFDPHGTLLWALQFDGPANKDDDASAIAVCPDGGVVVTGSSMVTGFYPDLLVLKVSADGRLIWHAALDGPGHQADEGEAVAVDSTGAVYVAGTTWAGSQGNDILLARLDRNGTILWHRTVDDLGHGDDVAVAGALTPDGDFVVTGVAGGSDDNGDVLTLCVDQDGNLKWTQRYHNPGDQQDQPADAVVDRAGNAFVAGTAGAALYDQNGNYLVLKYSESGAPQWEQIYDFANDWDRAASVAVDSAGNVFVTGSATGSSGRTTYGTLKYKPDGQLAWEAVYDAAGDASAAKLALDDRDNVFVTGTVSNGKLDARIVTVKYHQIGSTVPVELASFEARIHQDGVLLRWETKSESDNYGFEIQRQESGKLAWRKVGFVRGHGTTLKSHSYRYLDRSIRHPGFYRYRLRQIDITGTSTMSHPVSVSVSLPTSAEVLGAYPNPFNSEVVLKYRVQSGSRVTLKVFDASGRRVATLVDGWRDKGEYKARWDAGALPSGVYFARLTTGTASQVAKLVLLR